MRIFVDELPIKPEDCIFYKKESSRDDYSGNLYTFYRCSIDGYSCTCRTCDKLKIMKESKDE